MESLNTTNLRENPSSKDDKNTGRVSALLQEEVYDRGESIGEVLSIAITYKQALLAYSQQSDSENLDCIFWNLDTLILEAGNMLENPEQDLFLYLKALHAFKESVRNSFPFQNISAA
ncbi:hypothetical protein [Rufibacter latericius]|uniref:Uncharacterized protein n=1 Tax=Rufibacter latericius TaxID=2487040 RepID=A0A3M9MAL0_9BACT|nr:hypothetical protein [Rufibacter latericius]RNI22574.1 hypothetical protein EFB08_20975 [Rufibacter latericius]